MNKSLWSDETKLPSFSSLNKDIKTDVLIIGGGICGLLCALALKSAGTDCVICEASTLFSGTTKNSTAKITSQHGLIYNKLIKNFGKDSAKLYLEANENAIMAYETLCKDIDCDFEKKDSYVYSLASSAKIKSEVKALNSIGYGAKFVRKTELPFKVKGAVKFTDQAQFNPMKFALHYCPKLEIYENTPVLKISDGYAVTKGGTVKAKKIIVATHFPFLNTKGGYFLKMYQHRSYVSAFEKADILEGMYIDEAKGGLSLKSYNGLTFLGGGGARTGKKCKTWDMLHQKAKEFYPNSKLKYDWAAQDCISLDGIAYIGKYSKNTPNLFVATGFNKWGFTSSMVAAEILRDMCLEKENKYSSLFSPQRKMYMPQLLANGLESAKNLLIPSVRRCPHMGCALKWNKQEQSWDCPCHGSRFKKDGSLIDNPATDDFNAERS